MGGIVAGIAVIAVSAFGFFYLRRRRPGPEYAAPSSTFAADHAPFVFDESQPRSGSIEGPSDDGTHASSSIPASPMTSMRVYVRAFVPSFVQFVLLHVIFFYPPRTRTTQRRFQRFRQLPINRTPLPAQVMDRNKAQVTRWPPCRSRGHKGIVAYPFSEYHLSSFTLDSWRCSHMQNR